MQRWQRCAFALVALSASAAHGEPTPQERATAQAFFDRGLALMKDGKWTAACPALEESQRLDPGMGTQFQLGKCYEGQGRVASAWILYVDVAESAKTSGQPEKEKAARARAEAVAARVPKLQIEVAPSNAGAEIKRDGALVPKIQWGVPLPVDPGKHVVSASAPGKKAFEGAIDVRESEVVTLVVPALLAAPPASLASASPPVGAPPASAPAPASGDASASPRKTVGLVVGAVGVVGLGVGVALGLAAKSKMNGVGADCVGDRCDPAGIDARKSAVGTANLGTVIGGIGLLAVAGGAVLWLTAPSPEKKESAYLAPIPGGVALGGAF